MTIEVGKAGYESLDHDLGELVDSSRFGGLELVLPTGSTISGNVQWPDGESAVGAEVRVTTEDGEGDWFDFGDGRYVAQVEDDGLFRITGLSEGSYRVTASIRRAGNPVEGGGRRTRRAAPIFVARRDGILAGTAGLSMTLRSGRLAQGRVVDDTGSPVASFKIMAVPENTEIPAQISSEAISQQFATEDGSFALQGLGAGTWRLRVSARGFLSTEGAIFPPPGGGEIVLELRRPAQLSGVVLDAAGDPLRGALVEVTSEQPAESTTIDFTGGDECRTTSRSKGGFRLRRVAPGRVSVIASLEGFAPSEATLLDVVPGEHRKEVVVRLRAAARVTGEVLPSVGELEGAWVKISGLGFDHEHMCTIDDARRFEFDDLAPGGYSIELHHLGASEHDEYGLGFSRSEGSGHLLDKVDITLTTGAIEHIPLGRPPADPVTLTGTVTEGGAPVADERLTCRREGTREQSAPSWRATTDATGRYSLVVDGAGSYTLRVGNRRRTSIEHPLEIPAEGLRFDVELPVGSIGGIVLGPDGPLPGATVNVIMQRAAKGRIGGVGREVRTDADGRFRAGRLPAGEYTVHAGVDKWNRMRGGDSTDLARGVLHGIELDVDQQLDGLRIELNSGGIVEGSVTGPVGEPLADAGLRFEDVESGADLFPQDWFETDSAGRFRVEHVSAGRVQVSAWHDDFSFEDIEIEVREGATTPVELRAGG